MSSVVLRKQEAAPVRASQTRASPHDHGSHRVERVPRKLHASRIEGQRRGDVNDRTATVVIAVVTTVWAGNIVAGMFSINGYAPSESINGIFMAIVGGAFALRARARDKDDDKGAK